MGRSGCGGRDRDGAVVVVSHSQVSVLMAKVIQDSRVKAGVVQLLNELVQDPDVYTAVLELSHRILADEGVQASVSEMLIKSSHKVRVSGWPMAHWWGCLGRGSSSG